MMAAVKSNQDLLALIAGDEAEVTSVELDTAARIALADVNDGREPSIKEDERAFRDRFQSIKLRNT